MIRVEPRNRRNDGVRLGGMGQGAVLVKRIDKKWKQVLRELLDKRWRHRGQKMSALEYESGATDTLVT